MRSAPGPFEPPMAFQASPSLNRLLSGQGTTLVKSACERRNLRACVAADKSPARPAFLNDTPGTTGTLCANLFPLPILGGYGWLLNVWNHKELRDDSVVVCACKSGRTLSFELEPSKTDPHDATQSGNDVVKGVVTGNYNVASALAQMGEYSDAVLTVSNGPRQLTTRVSVSQESHSTNSFWSCPSLLFLTASDASVSSDISINDVFVDENPPPRKSKFEYFAIKG